MNLPDSETELVPLRMKTLGLGAPASDRGQRVERSRSSIGIPPTLDTL